ncbi:homocysteine S-methyltransferase [Homoserinibacter sp. YIM 151385]|uniref:homocysteine S-methyltransferase n=1 Tax=Homoserinibacter sp. YIM 151385 TaxID=2985506 RepID=UPI0022F1166E|nr:homocysteine S-methyltransferase [Homoserinibacter sp. YIM 151385]WBU38356.1 homocysteine S-methyltransferase [Homoserinibacter sp. YIM 151385]
MQVTRAQLLERVRVLDGGLGTLLESRGHDLGSELWSARLLLERPEAVREAHADFLAAGAEIAISASYQVSAEGLSARGLNRGAADAVLAASVRLAREARDAHGGGLVAASLGPYGAMLADGSEYRGDYPIRGAALRDWHRARVEVLAAAGADLLAAETIPSLDEVRAIAEAVRGTGAATWISVTADRGALRTGEPLAEAYAIAASVPEVVAIGVNCCDPAEVLPAIEAARATGLAFVAYPNSGEQWDAKNRQWIGAPGFPDRLVTDWLDAGARLVGGCCRVGTAEVGGIAAIVAAREHPVRERQEGRRDGRPLPAIPPASGALAAVAREVGYPRMPTDLSENHRRR